MGKYGTLEADVDSFDALNTSMNEGVYETDLDTAAEVRAGRHSHLQHSVYEHTIQY